MKNDSILLTESKWHKECNRDTHILIPVTKIQGYIDIVTEKFVILIKEKSVSIGTSQW